jgi:hypothetical protein
VVLNLGQRNASIRCDEKLSTSLNIEQRKMPTVANMNKLIDHANKVLYFATCLFYLSLGNYSLQSLAKAITGSVLMSHQGESQ